ncbi:MAG: YfhO family protein [Chloroflexi bacterium]|nr:YfhO family protein [Chloroflexota bacterium]
MTRRDIPAWLPLVLVALALFALFHRLLSGHTLFWGLPSLQFYPWRHYAFQLLSDGRLPGWNPYIGAGAPLLANYQTAVFYPPNWLFLVLPDPQAMNLIALVHVLWAGLGMWLFTGALGQTTFGRGMSTLAYALSGYLLGRFGSFPTADAAAWIPWVFWLVHRLLTLRRWHEIGWLALIVAMQLLAGHAQTTWYCLVGVGLYVVWQSVWGARTAPRRRRVYAVLLICAGMLLGLAMAAVQLVPTAEYFRESFRAGGMDYEFATNLSYSPLRLITLFSPNFYGTPADGSYITKGIYFEDAAYIGFIPIVSALAAIVGWFRRRRFIAHYPIFATVPFWALLALGALIIATGRYLPIFRLLYDYVPTFGFFREPVRWLILTVFGLSVLAGIGTQHWGRGKWIVFWSRLAAAGGGAAVVVALLAQTFMQPQNAENLQVLTRGLIVLGCWVVAAALFTLTQPQGETPRATVLWRTAVLVFVAIDLTWAASGLNPTIPTNFYRDFGVQRPEGRVYWFVDYEDEVKFERFFVLSDYRLARDQWPDVRGSLLPNLNMLDRVPLLNNFDPLVPRHHREYIDLIEELGPDAGPLLRAAGVSQVYGETRPAGWPGEAPIFVAPQETPRAWLVTDARWLESNDAVQGALRDPAWDPAQTVILAGEPPDDQPLPDGGPVGSLTVLEQRPNQLRYRVETESAAYLVLSHSWYPGWRATIDGRPAELVRANLAFQAVIIPPGGGDVTLRYHLTGWQTGAAISILALLLVFGVVALGSLLAAREPGSPESPRPVRRGPDASL